MIASENFVSKNVMEACGSVLTNKYAEGYVGKRYYNGCEIVDEVEQIGIDAAKQLFDCKYVNLQPHSGSSANFGVFGALLNIGDKVLGMSLDCGGHLTHGFKVSFSGKFYEACSYGVDKNSFLINYDEVEEIALREKPKMIIAGFSAYCDDIDWKKFRKIADKTGAYLMADIAHIAGLIAGKQLEDPSSFVDVITTTTHKTLRGARGGMILSNDEAISKKINSFMFPGLQGGPLMHQIAGKAMCFLEANDEKFQTYAKSVISNAKALAKELLRLGVNVLTGQTKNHIVILDLRKDGLFGSFVADLLNECDIICNKNNIPFDEVSPVKTSGVRLGTPALTTLGLNENHMIKIANIIADIVKECKGKASLEEVSSAFVKKQKAKVAEIVKDFDFSKTSLE
jgi:glycine hydroxymethyltransferase